MSISLELQSLTNDLMVPLVLLVSVAMHILGLRYIGESDGKESGNRNGNSIYVRLYLFTRRNDAYAEHRTESPK